MRSGTVRIYDILGEVCFRFSVLSTTAGSDMRQLAGLYRGTRWSLRRMCWPFREDSLRWSTVHQYLFLDPYEGGCDHIGQTRLGGRPYEWMSSTGCYRAREAPTLSQEGYFMVATFPYFYRYCYVAMGLVTLFYDLGSGTSTLEIFFILLKSRTNGVSLLF